MPQTKETICVLDDDASVRSSIEHLLDSDGLLAQTFERADDFLAHAIRHEVAVAVLDVWLPKRAAWPCNSDCARFRPPPG
jgi:FixJ family two-component response regulator